MAQLQSDKEVAAKKAELGVTQTTEVQTPEVTGPAGDTGADAVPQPVDLSSLPGSANRAAVEASAKYGAKGVVPFNKPAEPAEIEMTPDQQQGAEFAAALTGGKGPATKPGQPTQPGQPGQAKPAPQGKGMATQEPPGPGTPATTPLEGMANATAAADVHARNASRLSEYGTADTNNDGVVDPVEWAAWAAERTSEYEAEIANINKTYYEKTAQETEALAKRQAQKQEVYMAMLAQQAVSADPTRLLNNKVFAAGKTFSAGADMYYKMRYGVDTGFSKTYNSALKDDLSVQVKRIEAGERVNAGLLKDWELAVKTSETKQEALEKLKFAQEQTALYAKVNALKASGSKIAAMQAAQMLADNERKQAEFLMKVSAMHGTNYKNLVDANVRLAKEAKNKVANTMVSAAAQNAPTSSVTKSMGNLKFNYMRERLAASGKDPKEAASEALAMQDIFYTVATPLLDENGKVKRDANGNPEFGWKQVPFASVKSAGAGIDKAVTEYAGQFAENQLAVQSILLSRDKALTELGPSRMAELLSKLTSDKTAAGLTAADLRKDLDGPLLNYVTQLQALNINLVHSMFGSAITQTEMDAVGKLLAQDNFQNSPEMLSLAKSGIKKMLGFDTQNNLIGGQVFMENHLSGSFRKLMGGVSTNQGIIFYDSTGDKALSSSPDTVLPTKIMKGLADSGIRLSETMNLSAWQQKLKGNTAFVAKYNDDGKLSEEGKQNIKKVLGENQIPSAKRNQNGNFSSQFEAFLDQTAAGLDAKDSAGDGAIRASNAEIEYRREYVNKFLAKLNKENTYIDPNAGDAVNFTGSADVKAFIKQEIANAEERAKDPTKKTGIFKDLPVPGLQETNADKANRYKGESKKVRASIDATTDEATIQNIAQIKREIEGRKMRLNPPDYIAGWPAFSKDEREKLTYEIGVLETELARLTGGK